MGKLIYMDYAAATPLDGRVLAAMRPFFSQRFYNPSATYLPAVETRKALEAARAAVARQLGTRPAEIIFTAGGSEANNLAIHGVMRRFPDSNVVVSALEHDSVLKPAGRYDCRLAPVDGQGLIDLAALEKLIDDDTVLVSIMYANNEIGTVQPVKQIAALLAKKRAARSAAKPLLFHTDACQAANYLDLHVSRLGVDLMSLNGGKVYGPKQSGVLYARAGVELVPLVDGGGQEAGLRSGTENVAADVGFAAALEMAQAARPAETKRLGGLQQRFYELLARQLPAAVVNGSRKLRLPNNVHLTIPGVDNERLLMQLEMDGILAAAGSACSASSQQASHVLAGLGLDEAAARSSLRFSMGRGTSTKDVEQTVAALARLAAAG